MDVPYIKISEKFAADLSKKNASFQTRSRSTYLFSIITLSRIFRTFQNFTGISIGISITSISWKSLIATFSDLSNF